MNIEIVNGPGAAAAHIKMDEGESFIAEAGVMIAMKGPLRLETSTHKKNGSSILGGLKRMIAGESFFINHYSASGESDLYLAPNLAGDIQQVELEEGQTILVQGSSWLGNSESVNMDMSWQGFKNIFSGESMFWIKLTGPGIVLYNAFGAFYEENVSDDLIVDTGHIVAFEETLDFKISKAGTSWISSFLGGEGLVCRFKGQGKVWCQSHHPENFGKKLGPMLRQRKG